MNYILLLSAICFSDLTLAVSVLLLKCTLRANKYFLFWFLPGGLQKLQEIRLWWKLWLCPSAAVWQQKNRCRGLICWEEAHMVQPPPPWSLCWKGACMRAWPRWNREGEFLCGSKQKSCWQNHPLIPLYTQGRSLAPFLQADLPSCTQQQSQLECTFWDTLLGYSACGQLLLYLWCLPLLWSLLHTQPGAALPQPLPSFTSWHPLSKAQGHSFSTWFKLWL